MATLEALERRLVAVEGLFKEHDHTPGAGGPVKRLQAGPSSRLSYTGYVAVDTDDGVLKWVNGSTTYSVPVTKGDLLSYGTVPTLLAVGSNNRVLTADSVQPTGLKWADSVIVAAKARSDVQTAAVASVAAFTLGAADATILVSANVLVTTSTTHNFTVTCAYTDESNTARTLTLTFSQLGGTLLTAITNVTGAGPYEGIPLHIRCKASTSVTIATTGTFTTVTYNVEGLISQVA